MRALPRFVMALAAGAALLASAPAEAGERWRHRGYYGPPPGYYYAPPPRPRYYAPPPAYYYAPPPRFYAPPPPPPGFGFHFRF